MILEGMYAGTSFIILKQTCNTTKREYKVRKYTYWRDVYTDESSG